MVPRLLVAILVLLLLPLGGCTTTRSAGSSDTPSSRSRSNGDDEGMKPYSEVVPEDAVHDDGLFTTHWVKDGTTLLYEIPDSLLSRELLLVSRIARTAEEVGYGGQKANTQVVRWERHADFVLLRTVSYNSVASDSLPIYQAVRNATFEPIIGRFAVKALAEDSAGVVIDVTDLFTKDTPLLGLGQGARERFKVRRLDPARSFLMRAASYPENVEVRTVLTYEATEVPSNSSTGTLSFEMNHSMVLLPEEPMQARLFDQRVGYFTIAQTDYGLPAQRAEERRYIVRWRLEPSDPEAYARGELVEPVTPIVYYIDPATPEEWRPYLKQGIEDWQQAFEAAGFRNAILARDAPTPEEDPEFSPEDARYSVIRYYPSPVQNASGPHVHDPRSGEILESDINWYHNIMNLLRNWYFVQTAAANPSAQGVRFDREVMGELIRFVAAHEVGHTLGLRHNFYSSSAVPVDSLRSPTFTAANGTAPSIMDYARFNYVAQPGDGVTRFTPDIGAYDVHAVEWGYRRFPEAGAPDDEKPMLDRMARRANDDPRLRFVLEAAVATDPRAQNEDLGDDPVLAGQYGLANLARIVENLVEWTSEDLEGYATLDELYGQVVSQWVRYMNHAGSNVGGVYIDYRTAGEEGPVYTPVEPERQQRALRFVIENGFERPDWLLDADLLRRIQPAGVVDRVRGAQVGILNRLLDPSRMARLLEAEIIDRSAYTAEAMLADVRAGLWRELDGGEAVDPFRRNLQRGYVDRLAYLTTEEPTPPTSEFARYYTGYTPVNVGQSDIRPLVRGELQDLQRTIARALPRYRDDRTTRLHLEDVQARIEDILDPED